MHYDFRQIIDSISGKRTYANGKLVIQNEPLQFIFEQSEDSSVTESLFTTYRFIIPEDYRAFFAQYRSAVLFQHPSYGGGYDILSGEGVIDYWKDYSIDDPYYPIIWSSHSLGTICVNQKQVGASNGYLTWIASMDPDNPIDLQLSFSQWLSTLFEHDGKEFWLS